MVVIEAPIVHGAISVSALHASNALRIGNDTVDGIESTLNSTSFNPVSNSAVAIAINNVNIPPVANFFVQMRTDSGQTHTSGQVHFGTKLQEINSFVSGGVDTELKVISIPVTGTYSFFVSSVASNSSESVSIQLRKTIGILQLSSNVGTAHIVGTHYLNAGDAVYLEATSSTQASSSLTISLLKQAQEAPMTQGALLPRNRCSLIREVMTCSTSSDAITLVEIFKTEIPSETTTFSYLIAVNGAIVTRHIQICNEIAADAFITSQLAYGYANVVSYEFEYNFSEHQTITALDGASAFDVLASTNLNNRFAAAGKPALVSIFEIASWYHRTV